MNGHTNGLNFGQRMIELKRQRGTPIAGPGRPPRDKKYRPLIRKAEAAFAEALPVEAERYIAELAPKEPETCPRHGHVLCCPEEACDVRSRRTEYDFRAAAYLFDRVLGRPVTRSENALTARFLEETTAALLDAFELANAIPDPPARRAAFAARLAEFGRAHEAGGV